MKPRKQKVGQFPLYARAGCANCGSVNLEVWVKKTDPDMLPLVVCRRCGTEDVITIKRD
jgi:hypothetical protein